MLFYRSKALNILLTKYKSLNNPGEKYKMKKQLAVLMLAGSIVGSSFATGLTQLELAKLLVNKAVAEDLIENYDYSDDEIIDMVMKYDLMTVTDARAEMDVVDVRSVLGDYDKKKINISSDALTSEEKEDLNFTDEYEDLLKNDRKLSHGFMQMKSDNDELYDKNLDWISVEDNNFTYRDYDYPLINNYLYELYRILGWYAKEYDLYVKKTPASVALYADKIDFQLQSTPLIEVGFLENPTDDNDDGVAYSVRMKVSSLYFLKDLTGDKPGDKFNRIAEIGYKQAHLVMALKDVSKIFIKDTNELNAFVDSYVNDVIENQYKEYSYSKRRHEYFGDKRYYISKTQGRVFYYINHDLSTLGE
jgi:hypothetical protein